MTCIAAWCDGKDVWIGADSAGVSGMDVIIREDEKVFKNGKFLIPEWPQINEKGLQKEIIVIIIVMVVSIIGIFLVASLY